jgi:transcriptional regulator with XRE-family HTH domain
MRKPSDYQSVMRARGATILNRRKVLGWDQSELATRAQVQINFVKLIERGEMDAPHAIDRLFQTLNAELDRRRKTIERKNER